MKLVKPSQEHKQQIMDFRNAFLESKENSHGSASLEKFEIFEEWLETIQTQEQEEQLPPNRVPATQFVSIENGKVVGVLNLRHRLTPGLLIQSGHIGYSVHPNERQKGYASEQLRLALLEAKKLGIEKVLITCYKENIASAKTIQKAGGILENEVISPQNGELLQRYWINLS